MSVINKILSLLKENEITARKLTIDLNLANSAISEWKKGKAKPSIDAVIKIAKYFGVTTDYLLIDDEICDMVTPLGSEGSREDVTASEKGDEKEFNPEPNVTREIKEEDRLDIVKSLEEPEQMTREDKELLDYYHKLDEKDKQYIWCKIVVLEREYSE